MRHTEKKRRKREKKEVPYVCLFLFISSRPNRSTSSASWLKLMLLKMSSSSTRGRDITNTTVLRDSDIASKKGSWIYVKYVKFEFNQSHCWRSNNMAAGYIGGERYGELTWHDLQDANCRMHTGTGKSGCLNSFRRLCFLLRSLKPALIEFSVSYFNRSRERRSGEFIHKVLTVNAKEKKDLLFIPSTFSCIYFTG